jgi:hypothetical protein
MHMTMRWRADAAVGRIDIAVKLGGSRRAVNRNPSLDGPIRVMSRGHWAPAPGTARPPDQAWAAAFRGRRR